MKRINISAAAAEDALLELAGHVPVGVPIGRPTIAAMDADGSVSVLTDRGALWEVTGSGVDRTVPFGDAGRFEVTRWELGREISRLIS